VVSSAHKATPEPRAGGRGAFALLAGLSAGVLGLGAACLPDLAPISTEPTSGEGSTPFVGCGDGVIATLDDGGDAGESCDPGKPNDLDAQSPGCRSCQIVCEDGGVIDPRTGHCYFAAAASDSYQAAITSCKARGAHVVTFASKGEVALVQGDHARAVRLLAEAMSYSEETGNAYSVANISASLGLIAVAQGRLENAASAFKKTLDVGRRTDSVMLCLMALFGYGRISAQSGDLRQALHLFGFVSNHPAISPDLSHLVDDALAALRASLPPDEFNAAFDSGKVLSIDAALDLILFNSNNVTL